MKTILFRSAARMAALAAIALAVSACGPHQATLTAPAVRDALGDAIMAYINPPEGYSEAVFYGDDFSFVVAADASGREWLHMTGGPSPTGWTREKGEEKFRAYLDHLAHIVDREIKEQRDEQARARTWTAAGR